LGNFSLKVLAPVVKNNFGMEFCNLKRRYGIEALEL